MPGRFGMGCILTVAVLARVHMFLKSNGSVTFVTFLPSAQTQFPVGLPRLQ